MKNLEETLTTRFSSLSSNNSDQFFQDGNALAESLKTQIQKLEMKFSESGAGNMDEIKELINNKL